VQEFLCDGHARRIAHARSRANREFKPPDGNPLARVMALR
jgi:hypothetical protein